MTTIQDTDPTPRRAGLPVSMLRTMLQPVLSRVVRKIAADHPEMFERIAPYQQADFLIAPKELPFALHLRPDPDAPLFRMVQKAPLPPHDAMIEGPFYLLLNLVDGESDGDAAFFSRDLAISGNTEAVVSLRNALDDIDGSIAQETANLFGPPGRAILGLLRRRGKAHVH